MIAPVAAASEEDEAERLARSRRVFLLREKWRADRDAGRLPPPPRRPSPPLPVNDEHRAGVPDGCEGQFPLPRPNMTLEERSEALANALEEKSAATSFGLKAIDIIPFQSAVSMGAAGLFDAYSRRGCPYVTRGEVAERWNVGAWCSQNLVTAYGEQPWSVRRGEDYSQMCWEVVTLRDYLDSSSSGIQHGPKPYGANNEVIQEMIPNLTLPIGYPPHAFRRSHTRLWIGPEGSGVHCHRDLQDNFVAMVHGRKRFYLTPPHGTPCLGGHRLVTPFLHEAVNAVTHRESQADSLCSTIEVDLESGDVLYLPAGWWHATLNLDDLGISVNFFLASCYAALGVIVPDLLPSDWMPGLEPGTECGGHGSFSTENLSRGQIQAPLWMHPSSESTYVDCIVPTAQRIRNRRGVIQVSVDASWPLARRMGLQNCLFLEFGVFQGRDIGVIAGKLRGKHSDSLEPPVVHGFDSFRGLPTDWENKSNSGREDASPGFRPGSNGDNGAAASGAYPKGTFDLGGILPVVDDNVRLHCGWFNDTLPPFLDGHAGSPCAFVHMDADLYSSTIEVLTLLFSRGHIIPGTVLNFDEFINYEGWERGEYAAWIEATERFGVEWAYLCYHGPQSDFAPDTRFKSNEFGFKSVSVRVTGVRGLFMRPGSD